MICKVMDVEKTAFKLSEYLYGLNYITENEIDGIAFAIEVVLTNLITFSVIIMIGLFCRMYTYTFLFLFIFIVFRTMRDRFHAKTFVQCFFLTVGSFLLCLLMPNMLLNSFQESYVVKVTTINLLVPFYFNRNKTISLKLLLSDKFNIGLFTYCIISILTLFFYEANISIFLVTLGFILVISSEDFSRENYQ